MWAQHFSGTFSQLDLRSSTRPIDAVPRAAMTWDATGSLTFVAGRPGRWEIPYDDMCVILCEYTYYIVFIFCPRSPDKRAPAKRRTKTLGEKPFIPNSQTVGTMSGHGLMEDTEIFVKLAHGYTIEDADKTILCSRNAEVCDTKILATIRIQCLV